MNPIHALALWLILTHRRHIEALAIRVQPVAITTDRPARMTFPRVKC